MPRCAAELREPREVTGACDGQSMVLVLRVQPAQQDGAQAIEVPGLDLAGMETGGLAPLGQRVDRKSAACADRSPS
jgi:hypothetical protein